MFHLKIFFQYFATDQAVADELGDKEAINQKKLKDQASRIITFNTEDDKANYLLGLEASDEVTDKSNKHYLQAIKDMAVYNQFQIIASEVTLNGDRIMHSPNIIGGVGIMFHNITGKNFDIDTKKYTPRKHKQYLKMMEHDLGLKLIGKLEYFNHGVLVDSVNID